MNHVDNHRTKGFTLVELMLAMTFISVLLLAIALTILQVGTIYNKGMVLKEVNQAGRTIGDDVDRTVSAAETFSVTTDLVPSAASNPSGGRLCLGSYSYIWNYQKGLANNASDVVWYEGDLTKAVSARTEVHFVKVPDAGKIYCAKDSNGILSYKSIRILDTPQAKELLPAGDHTLAVEQFGLVTSASAYDALTNQRLYTLSYTLGSGNLSAMDATQTGCLPPSSANSDLTYCSVEQFSLVLRTGNRVN